MSYKINYKDGLGIPSESELEENFIDISQNINPLLNEIPETAYVYKSESYEIALFKYQMEDVKKQFRIQTATWGLAMWEERYGIVTDLTDSLENRRARVLAKKRGYGTTTKQRIKDIIKSWNGCNSEVYEQYTHKFLNQYTHNELSNKTYDELKGNDYEIKIVFTDTVGIPANMDDVKNAINEIIPAHLNVVYVFSYKSYDDLKIYTHNQLSLYTHNNIRNNRMEE